VLRQFADELTGLYDDIAKVHPILYELRECMKVVALAGWLKKKGLQLKFPAEAAVTGILRRKPPGIVEIVLAVKEGPVGLMILGSRRRRFRRPICPRWRTRLEIREERRQCCETFRPTFQTVSPIEKNDHQLQEI